ncbi:pirin family protein [Oleiagrimonas sp. C23AA]|uniref:pirin family protein n=1 Tax=Oleiagrimonas sp. C23AA TaxID=2719047 RepID=UPI001421F89B|nr:pirin family protein [Oleiagrimonas sp. C23AA]NII09732.1 pirin family protein [Oleiagrimonas sp. C23AA]
MLTLRHHQARGHADHGWLDSWHSFSFASYRDPEHMGFGALRVINEDRVQPGKGFATHSHQNMEIISYVLEGELAHRDSMGNSSTIRPGDVQRMSAGSGVTHSEYNPSQTQLSHFLQIWILPAEQEVAPSYEQTHVVAADKRDQLRLLVSGDGAEGSLRIHQDARLYAGLLDGAADTRLPLASGRLGYVHVARGRAKVNDQWLDTGDALKLTDEPAVTIEAGEQAEVLVFDLPR